MSQSELTDPAVDTPATAEVGAERPTWVRYQVLMAACVLAVITYVHRIGFATASARFKVPLGLNDEHLGYLMAAFLVAYGLFEMPWGLAGDRLGVRSVLAILVLGGSLATAGVALVAWLPHVLALQLGFLIVLRFIFGLFQAGTFPALSRLTADWMPTTERASAQGLIWMSTRIGGAIIPVVLGKLFGWFGDWPAPLVVIGGLGVVWCAAFWPWYRNRPEEMPTVNAAERKLIAAGRASKPGAGHAPLPWGKALRSANVWALCLMYGFLGFTGNFFITMLPNYLMYHRHLDQDTNWVTSLPFAFGVITCIAGGLWSDRIIKRTGNRKLGRRLVGATGLGLGAAAIVLVPWVQPTWLMAILLALAFSGNDLAMGPAWAAAADIGGRYAGTLGGAMNMLGSLLGACQAILTGYLLQRGWTVLPFVIFATSFALGSLCWLRVDVTETMDDL